MAPGTALGLGTSVTSRPLWAAPGLEHPCAPSCYSAFPPWQHQSHLQLAPQAQNGILIVLLFSCSSAYILPLILPVLFPLSCSPMHSLPPVPIPFPGALLTTGKPLNMCQSETHGRGWKKTEGEEAQWFCLSLGSPKGYHSHLDGCRMLGLTKSLSFSVANLIECSDGVFYYYLPLCDAKH